MSPVVPEAKQYLSLRECAVVVGLSTRTLRRAIASGTSRAIQAGWCVRVARSALLAYIERNPLGASRG